MIRNIRHRGLRLLHEQGTGRGVQPEHVRRLRAQLATLNIAGEVEEIDQPTYHFHELTGNRRGTYAITVRANWRLTFRFEDGDVLDLDYEDYHVGRH